MARRWIATDFGGLEVFRDEQFDVPPPAPHEVTIAVRAAGMNPVDYKRVAAGSDRNLLPLLVGFEVSGVITAVGGNVQFAVGDEVVAFRIKGGYATDVTAPARDVFAKPPNLTFAEAANLLLAGCTAAEMLHVVDARPDETVLLHGAAGSVGVSVLQLARARGIRVIGTANEGNFDRVREFGGEPVAYGKGLLDRVSSIASRGIDAALDAAGTQEATDVSLELVADRRRILTIASPGRASAAGFQAISGTLPASATFRDTVRPQILELAGSGDLTVPVAHSFPLAEALQALELLRGGHPGGKLALLP